MIIYSGEDTVSRMRHLPGWLHRNGSLEAVLRALIDGRVSLEIRSAFSTLCIWPSWAHVYPLPVESASVTVTEQSTGRKIRVYRSDDPLGALYRPNPFFVGLEDRALFFHLGLIEHTVSTGEQAADGSYLYRLEPAAQPLERLFVKHGRSWQIALSDRDGHIRLPDGGQRTFRYLPAGDLPVMIGPDGLPLQTVALQYWQRVLAQLAGITDPDGVPTSVLLQKMSRLYPPHPLFGIAGELELSGLQEVAESWRAQQIDAALSYHDEHPQWTRYSSAGQILLPALDVPSADVWTAKDISASVPDRLPAGTGRFGVSPVASAQWYGLQRRSGHDSVQGGSIRSLRVSVLLGASRAVNCALQQYLYTDTSGTGIGYLPAPVWAQRIARPDDAGVGGWISRWEGTWFQPWERESSFEHGSWASGWEGVWFQPWESITSGADAGYEQLDDLCAISLHGSGQLWVYGTNTFGQLGDHSDTGAGNPVWTPQQLGAITSLRSVSVGATHMLVLTADKLYAAGSNRYGQWGTGSADGDDQLHLLTDITSSLPSGVTPSDIRQVAAAWHVSFLLLKDGSVYGCGGSRYGVLGMGGSGTDSNPLLSWTAISALSGIRELVVCDTNAYAIAGDGSVYASGDNRYGQYGNGSTTSSGTWQQVDTSAMGGVYRLCVDSGATHVTVLAISAQDFSLYGWGANIGSRISVTAGIYTRPTLVPLPAQTPLRDVACGSDVHGKVWAACIDRAGRVYVWGDRASGVVGNSHGAHLQDGVLAAGDAIALSAVDTGIGAPLVEAYSRHPHEALWFVNGDRLWVWGDRSVRSTFYLGSAQNMVLDTSVEGIRWASIPNHPQDGGYLGMVVDRFGRLRCCGDDIFGATGSGQYPAQYSGWQEVQLAPWLDGRLTRVFTSGWSTFVIDDSGRLYAAGANHSGQLGLGVLGEQIVEEFTPLYTVYDSAREVVTVRNTDTQSPIGWSLIVTEQGDLYTCGHNEWGQLGVGDTNNRSEPVLVDTDVVSASGIWLPVGGFSAYLTGDGYLYVMGSLYTGADGGTIGTPRYTDEPVLVSGIPQGNISHFAIAHGGGMIAVDGDGMVWAWGPDVGGSIGAMRGDAAAITPPIPVYRVDDRVLACGSYTGGTFVLTEGGLYLTGKLPYGYSLVGAPVATGFDRSGYFSTVEQTGAVRLASTGSGLVVVCRDSRWWHIGELPFPTYSASRCKRSVLSRLELDRYRNSLNT